ncbi:hypothetical protein ACQRBL_30715 [Bacillus sp. AF62]|uniref:hypothetical protein n=1 Tax=Bacillus sp. AF62 TaxID=3158960 RepID=UPI003D05B731
MILPGKRVSLCIHFWIFMSFATPSEWFGIEDCINSQIWFFGTFGIAIAMLFTTYLITGFLYGF